MNVKEHVKESKLSLEESYHIDIYCMNGVVEDSHMKYIYQGEIENEEFCKS